MQDQEIEDKIVSLVRSFQTHRVGRGNPRGNPLDNAIARANSMGLIRLQDRLNWKERVLNRLFNEARQRVEELGTARQINRIVAGVKRAGEREFSFYLPKQVDFREQQLPRGDRSEE